MDKNGSEILACTFGAVVYLNAIRDVVLHGLPACFPIRHKMC